MKLADIFYTASELKMEEGKIDIYSLFLGVTITFLILAGIAYGIFFINGNVLMGAAIFFPIVGSLMCAIATYFQQNALKKKMLDELFRIPKKVK
jgi:membrane associated rhomboid family serine protease